MQYKEYCVEYCDKQVILIEGLLIFHVKQIATHNHTVYPHLCVYVMQ